VDGEPARESRVEMRESRREKFVLCFLPPLFFPFATHFGTQKNEEIHRSDIKHAHGHTHTERERERERNGVEREREE
jgi:hypothetical protein